MGASSIGPTATSLVGVKGIDVGLPTFSMHSVRELFAVKDLWNSVEFFKMFWKSSYFETWN